MGIYNDGFDFLNNQVIAKVRLSLEILFWSIEIRKNRVRKKKKK